jgi:ribosomal protein S8
MNHLANYISCIQVGIKCHKTEVCFVRTTRFLRNFIKAIYSSHLIYSYKFFKNGNNIHGEVSSTIRFFSIDFLKNVKILSTPGRKMYVSSYKLKNLIYMNKKKVFIISTSHTGIISGTEAIKNNIGGELICEFLFK